LRSNLLLKFKRVLVIGSGPSGMEAARVAALRGQQSNYLRKKLQIRRVASACFHVKRYETDELLALIKYLDRQMRKAGVNNQAQ